MNLQLRHLFKDIFIYGIGDILLKATAFITLPIYTRIFTPEDYGIWSFISTTIGLLSGILILGGDSAYARFFFEAKTEEEKQIVTSTSLFFLAFWSLGVILLCLPFTSFFSQWSLGNAKYASLFILALLAAPIALIHTMCGQILRNQFRAKLFTLFNLISTFLSIVFSLCGVVILDMGLIGIMGGTLLASAIILPIRLWTVRTMLRPAFSFSILKNLLGYGIPLVPMSLAYWVFASSDRFVLGKLSTLDQLGLYSVANSATSILSFINGALSQAWSPYAVRLYEEKPQEAPLLYGRLMTYILVVFGLLCVGITTFAREVLIILSTPDFYSASLAVGPLALGFMAYTSTQITASGISLTKKTYYFTIYSWIAALINLVLNILLIPKWGMVAASWTTAISYIFLTLAYLITSQRLWSVAYEKRRAIVTIVLTLVFTITAPLIPSLSSIENLLIKSIYCLAYLLFIFIFQALNQREWKALLTLLP